MTCIVGIETASRAIIGGDSCAATMTCKTVISDPKVFENNGIIIGYTTSFRMGQLLQYSISSNISNIENIERFVHTEFIKSVRRIFKDNGWSTVSNNVEDGGNFIVAINGEMFEVQSDFSVLKHADGIYAIGSGKDFALGAMFSCPNKNEAMLTVGLEAAAHYSPFVSKPFTFVTSRKKIQKGEWGEIRWTNQIE